MDLGPGPTVEPEPLNLTPTDLVREVKRAEQIASVTEARPNDVVVLAVRGIIILTGFALAGTVGLIGQGKNPPDGLIGVAGAGVGSLSTLLTVRARGDGT